MESSSHKKKTKVSLASISTANRINDLPDEILCHILSFLPTKHAATTSVLSKRWKPLWLSILALNFDDEISKDSDSFRKFVAFTLRHKNVPIHSFNFKCGRSSQFAQRQYDRILKFVMLRGIKNLDFNMSNKKGLTKLPPRIFSFKMLQVLKLKNMEVGDFDQVDFPHLKTLHLNSIHFKYHEHIVKFLLGCPILENLQSELYISDRKDDIIENLNVLPNLVKVRIFGWNTPLSLVCKTKILHLEEVVLMTSTKLPVFHNLSDIPMFQNLTHLNIRIQKLIGWKESFEHDFFIEQCMPLLGILPNAPKLRHFYIQDCWNNYWNDPLVVAECLSLQLKTFCIRGYKGSKYEFGLAKYILQHSKVLETMTIKSACLSKHQMQLKFSSCIRSSTACKLVFD